MNKPRQLTPLLQGAAIGAIACAILGFTWGGWVTGSTARADAGLAAHNATVQALAPICADRFRAQADASTKMAELAKASTWERSGFVEKSGFTSLPGSKTSDPDIARACADLLMTPPTPKT